MNNLHHIQILPIQWNRRQGGDLQWLSRICQIVIDPTLSCPPICTSHAQYECWVGAIIVPIIPCRILGLNNERALCHCHACIEATGSSSSVLLIAFNVGSGGAGKINGTWKNLDGKWTRWVAIVVVVVVVILGDLISVIIAQVSSVIEGRRWHCFCLCNAPR